MKNSRLALACFFHFLKFVFVLMASILLLFFFCLFHSSFVYAALHRLIDNKRKLKKKKETPSNHFRKLVDVRNEKPPVTFKY